MKKIPYFLIIIEFFLINFNVYSQSWNPPIMVDGYLGTGSITGIFTAQCIVKGHPAIAYYDSFHKNLLYNIAQDSSGSIWNTPIEPDNSGHNIGGDLSFTTINGKPAIVYVDETESIFKFIIACDSLGLNWSEPVSLLNGYKLSLTEVNGYPAISYFSSGLKYMIANDSIGESWQTPVIVDTIVNIYSKTCLKTINGRPGIAYNDVTSQQLKYVSSTDSFGSAWTIPLSIEAVGNQGAYPDLEEIYGFPAISYYNNPLGDLKYVISLDSSGSVWGSSVTVDGLSNVGWYSSLEIINGFPGIAYFDITGGDLKFVRAIDSLGNNWNTSIIVASTGIVGKYSSLAISNGKPSIVYNDQSSGGLCFIRSIDINGNLWSAPILFTSPGDAGQYISIDIINQFPAIAYYDVTGGNLKYVRALNETGSEWGVPVVVDNNGNVGQYTSLTYVAGFPAICYYDIDNGFLKYVRATDSTGSTWGVPITVDATANVGQFASMKIINGAPAISYYDVTNKDLKFVRASNNIGSSWNIPVLVEADQTTGQYTSLAEVNGFPAISYYDVTASDLMYVRALNASGSSWGTPQMIDGTNLVGTHTCLAIVANQPAISYRDFSNTSLKYVRANDINGSAWGTPIEVDVTGAPGLYSSLKVIHGQPAIAYYDVSGSDVDYVSANDNIGATWQAPNTLVAYTTINVGQYTSLIETSNGVGIAYYSSTKRSPYYIYGGNPPSISSNPINVSTCEADTVNFTVSAADATNYVWQVDQGAGFTDLDNGSIYDGVNDSILTINGVTNEMHNSTYRCIVSGLFNPADTSGVAILAVTMAVSANVEIAASDTIVCEGNNVLFSATATNGGSNPSYQWLLNGNSIIGANDSFHSTSNFYNGDSINVVLYSDKACILNPQDTSVAIVMQVNSHSISIDSISACDYYYWSIDSSTYTTSGIYFDTLVNQAGCDSVLCLVLNLFSSNASMEVVSACEGYTWPLNSNNYTSSGIYTDTIIGSFGCDSIVTLDLTINSTVYDTIEISECNFYIWEANSLTYTESGVYSDTLINVNGCDSLVTLDLTIYSNDTVYESASNCNYYTWEENQETYYSSGIYAVVLNNSAGCDSVILLDLTILESDSVTESVTSCDFYLWSSNGQMYDVSGIYYDPLINSSGCDSILSLNLNIISIDTSISLNGNVLLANGTGDSYQWLDCNDNMNTIISETNSSYTAIISGNYALEISQGNCIDTSFCYYVNIVGLQYNSFKEIIDLYPNPTNGVLNLKLGESIGSVSIIIYDAEGKRIYKEEYNNSNEIMLNIEGEPGHYFIEISNGKDMARFQVIKSQ